MGYAKGAEKVGAGAGGVVQIRRPIARGDCGAPRAEIIPPKVEAVGL